MRGTMLIGLVLISLTFGVESSRADESKSKRPPNVVMIISDDHGWTDYSFMGHRQVQTPRLDRLASQSLTYRRGYVPSSLCCPSLASIITGRYPHQHKITCNDPPNPDSLKGAAFHKSAAFRDGRETMNRHLESVPTLPRLLAQKGYLSFQSGKWWQGDFKRGGFTHGMTHGGRHGDDGLKIGRASMKPIEDFMDMAIQENKPFFVWYAPMMPHDPHTPPERILKKYREKTSSLPQAKYWAMVEWFDETCGQLLDSLDQRKLAENTIVVYVTDNGWIQDPNKGASIRSKRTPYDAGLRTPIMIRWSGKVQPKILDDQFAQSIDLLPTLLTALKIDLPQGLPGLDLLDPQAVAKRKAVFGACFTHDAVDLNDPSQNLMWRWVVSERWKYILPKQPGGSAELYDVLADPAETTNLVKDPKHSDLVKKLQSQLDIWWSAKS